jgi:hypothetical protein
MKQLNAFTILLGFFMALTSCKKGDTGPAGSAGIAGNANVTQYTFGTTDLSAQITKQLNISTTEDSMNRSAWFVYLIHSNALVYPLPGFGINGSSEYRAYWGFGQPTANKVNLSISRISGAGEQYVAIKVIRIYANTVSPGGRMSNSLPDIDYNDYYAVCNYYHLPY